MLPLTFRQKSKLFANISLHFAIVCSNFRFSFFFRRDGDVVLVPILFPSFGPQSWQRMRPTPPASHRTPSENNRITFNRIISNWKILLLMYGRRTERPKRTSYRQILSTAPADPYKSCLQTFGFLDSIQGGADAFVCRRHCCHLAKCLGWTPQTPFRLHFWADFGPFISNYVFPKVRRAISEFSTNDRVGNGGNLIQFSRGTCACNEFLSAFHLFTWIPLKGVLNLPTISNQSFSLSFSFLPGMIQKIT